MTHSKRPNRLYKNPREGKIMGVCAGFAEYMNINANAVRVLYVLAMLVWGWLVVPIILYFVLGMVLEEKPEELYKDPEEEDFWREARSQPRATTSDMRRRFRDVEERIQRMEAYMTSKRFRLDRDLRDLEN